MHYVQIHEEQQKIYESLKKRIGIPVLLLTKAEVVCQSSQLQRKKEGTCISNMLASLWGSRIQRKKDMKSKPSYPQLSCQTSASTMSRNRWSPGAPAQAAQSEQKPPVFGGNRTARCYAPPKSSLPSSQTNTWSTNQPTSIIRHRVKLRERQWGRESIIN